MIVYVGGRYGEMPAVISPFIEVAMAKTAQNYLTYGFLKQHGHVEQWTCTFVDGENPNLRCTTTITESDDVIRLYVERMEIDDVDPEEHRFREDKAVRDTEK